MTDYGTSSRDDREAGKARRAKVHKLADTVMRWLIVLVVAIIFVVLADELMSAPFSAPKLKAKPRPRAFTALLSLRSSHMLPALSSVPLSGIFCLISFCVSSGRPFIALNSV